MGYELVPGYVAADPGGQATLAATFAATALVTNAAGNFLGWGVVVPLYAVAILTTRALPRWIGWLGLPALAPKIFEAPGHSALGVSAAAQCRGGSVGAKLASAAWPHPMSLLVLPGADRCGQSCACSIDSPILAPNRRILMMSASAMGR
jgi:hypothetical protein